jgi:hypothetical protein
MWTSCLSVRFSVTCCQPLNEGHIFKFHVDSVNVGRRHQFLLKSGRYNGHFPWRWAWICYISVGEKNISKQAKLPPPWMYSPTHLYINTVICIQPRLIFTRRELVPCTTGDPACLFWVVFSCMGVSDSKILCEYKMRGSSFWEETCWWALPAGVIPSWFKKNPLKWNSHLECLRPSNTSYSWMVILLFKDDESYVDPESSYALSRRVSGCPSTKFGVRIHLKPQALPATSDITLDLWLVHFGRTPRQ